MKSIKLAVGVLLCNLYGGVDISAQTKEVVSENKSACCTAEKSIQETSRLNYKMIKETPAKGEKLVACKLTIPELQKRKAEVLALLKAKVLEKEELETGYQYRFHGSDEVLEELIKFIKTERDCCNFFTFQLMVEDAASPIILRISGPQLVKEFIATEMGL